MKIARTLLAEHLAHAARVAASTGIDIAQCVLMEASSGVLTIHATDFSAWIETRVPCEGGLDQVAVNAGRTLDAVSAMRADELEVEADDGKLIIKGKGGGKRQINMLATTAFPPMPAIPDDAAVAMVEKGAFSAAMAFALPHIHGDPKTHAYLTGVRLHSLAGGLRAVGANGSSLAYSGIECEAGEIAATITKPFVDALIGAAPDGAQIKLSVSPRLIAAEWEGGRIQGPLIEENFPEYQRFIPEASNHKLAVRANEFAEAIASVKALANAKSSRVVLTGSELRADSQIGDAVEPMDAEWDGPDDFRIGFSVPLSIACLKGFGAAEMTVSFIDAAKPIVFREVGRDDRLTMLSPMRI